MSKRLESLEQQARENGIRLKTAFDLGKTITHQTTAIALFKLVEELIKEVRKINERKIP